MFLNKNLKVCFHLFLFTRPNTEWLIVLFVFKHCITVIVSPIVLEKNVSILCKKNQADIDRTHPCRVRRLKLTLIQLIDAV